jgi:hypothetical protein
MEQIYILPDWRDTAKRDPETFFESRPKTCASGDIFFNFHSPNEGRTPEKIDQ